MHKVKLVFPNKLGLAPAGLLTRASIILVHGVLVTGFIIPFYGPFMAILCAMTLLVVEATRRNPFARDAIIFAAQRCALFALLSVILIALVPHLPKAYTPLWYWYLSCFVIVPLALHDLWSAYNGRLGLCYIRLKREVNL